MKLVRHPYVVRLHEVSDLFLPVVSVSPFLKVIKGPFGFSSVSVK